MLALGVGLWVAVNPLLVQDSHYARPEAFLTLVTLGLVLTAFGRPPRRAGGGPSLAGVLFGLVVACKVTLGLWFWLPLLACYPGPMDAAHGDGAWPVSAWPRWAPWADLSSARPASSSTPLATWPACDS